MNVATTLRAILAISFIVLAQLPAQVSGQVARETHVKLKKLKVEVQSEERQLSQLLVERKRLLKAVDSYRGQIKEIKSVQKRVSKELTHLRAEEQVFRDSLANLERELQQLIGLSEQRMRALYVTRPQDILHVVLSGQQSSDLGRAGIYLAKIRQHDLQLIAQIQSVRSQRREKKLELERVIAGKAEREREARSYANKLAKKVREIDAALERIKLRESQAKDAVTRLRAQALRLETVMASLTGGVQRRAVARVRSAKESADRSVTPRRYQGGGLIKGSKGLVHPVVGTLVGNFGKRSHRAFKDLVLNKGWEYRAQPGAKVGSIAAGRVMYAGKLPGYGDVVIVDHGKRHYSLSGRLKDMEVTVGDVVEREDKVGSVGAEHSEGGNFYFEIRVNGKAVNPRQFYR